MLRNILIAVGLLVALDPYLGFPQSIDKFILTGLGFFIVFLIALTRRTKSPQARVEDERPLRSNHHDMPKVLHVERTTVAESPRMHVERKTIANMLSESDGSETVVEKKTTTLRRRKKVLHDETGLTPIAPHLNDHAS
jgi:hypothetical protein